MAAAFVAMNEVYGNLFDVSRAEAQTPEMAKERAGALSKQFVMDCHTHFLRDDRAIAELKPDSFKGYTIGDNTNKNLSKYPWRLDDEKMVYPFYERMQKAGLVNICIHKGLFPPSVEKQFPHLLAHSDVRPIASPAAARRMTPGPSSSRPGASSG